MRRAIAATLAAGFVLAACSSGGSGGSSNLSASPVATTKVDAPRSYKFVPAVITVTAGSTVTWTNHDNFPHTVKLLNGSGELEQLPIGGTAQITFDQAGTFDYECTIHPSLMKGKVIVTGS